MNINKHKFRFYSYLMVSYCKSLRYQRRNSQMKFEYIQKKDIGFLLKKKLFGINIINSY